MLGRGDRVAARGVHHDHAAAGGGIDIDIIHTDAGAANDLEQRGGLDEPGGRLGLAAHHQRGEVRDDVEELIFFQPGLHGHVELARAAQLSHTAVGNGIGNKNFWNVHKK